MKHHVDITVRQANGTYLTSTVNKMNASCTSGEKQTAERLGDKLYGDAFIKAEPLPGTFQIGITMWRLHGSCDHVTRSRK